MRSDYKSARAGGMNSLVLPMATVMFGTALLVNFLKSRRI